MPKNTKVGQNYMVSPVSLESRESWREEYAPIPLESVTVRHWKLEEDTRPAEAILKKINHELKPILPEGHVWSFLEGRLEILRHNALERSDFRIHLFGPDEKERLGYLVVDIKGGRSTPLFGYTMAKREGFPRDLRNIYPEDSTFFAQDGTTFWRGHILDYQDTIGQPADGATLSTLFASNYKPETEGAWSRTIRKEIVGDIRAIEGSYSELMLYGFDPEESDRKKKIPKAVFLSTFTSDKEYLTSYHVAKNDPCHEWSGVVKTRIKTLAKKNALPALFATLPFEHKPIPENNLTELEGYELLRNAEMEHCESTYKLQYVLFAKSKAAPGDVLNLWLERSVSMAYKVAVAFRGMKPAFPHALVSRLKDGWDPEDPSFQYIERLGDIAIAILRGVSPRDLVITRKQAPRFVPSSIQTEVVCVGAKNKAYPERENQIYQAIAIGSSMHLSEVTSEVAKKLFPVIAEKAREKSPDYIPILSVKASCTRWEKKVESLTIQYFGPGKFKNM